MNLLNIEHISKIYGEKIIFDDASFGVQEGDKIGIVGINGTGKTTLLRMIAGTEVPDDGQIIRQNGMKIAHLTQNPVFPEGDYFILCAECGRRYGVESTEQSEYTRNHRSYNED